MYLGGYQLGSRLPLAVQTADGSDLPVWPDAAPAASLYPAAGGVPVSVELPPADPVNSPGLFVGVLHLDRRFAAGDYRVRYSWLVGGAPREAEAFFTIQAGGDPDGSVIAMFRFAPPHAEYNVQQLDSGVLVKGKNPSV